MKKWARVNLLTQAYAILCPKAWDTFAMGAKSLVTHLLQPILNLVPSCPATD